MLLVDAEQSVLPSSLGADDEQQQVAGLVVTGDDGAVGSLMGFEQEGAPSEGGLPAVLRDVVEVDELAEERSYVRQDGQVLLQTVGLREQEALQRLDASAQQLPERGVGGAEGEVVGGAREPDVARRVHPVQEGVLVKLHRLAAETSCSIDCDWLDGRQTSSKRRGHDSKEGAVDAEQVPLSSD